MRIIIAIMRKSSDKSVLEMLIPLKRIFSSVVLTFDIVRMGFSSCLLGLFIIKNWFIFGEVQCGLTRNVQWKSCMFCEVVLYLQLDTMVRL